MIRLLTSVLVLILFLSAGSPATAQPFTALLVFGDSTVDTGWYRTASSGEDNYDYYMHQSALGVGKPTSSPGQVSVEVLATALGLTALPANQANGTNYATGGARNVGQNTMPGDGFPGAVPTVKQIKNYLAANQNHASSTALYVISSGDNDVAYALKHPGNKHYLQKAAYSLANEINTLRQDGAKYILVVGLPQSFGSTSQKKAFRRIYNQKLRQKLGALGVPYLWGSTNRARRLMEKYKGNPPSNPSPFGITNYTLGSTTCSVTCSACPVPTPDPQCAATDQDRLGLCLFDVSRRAVGSCERRHLGMGRRQSLRDRRTKRLWHLFLLRGQSQMAIARLERQPYFAIQMQDVFVDHPLGGRQRVARLSSDRRVLG